MKKEWVKAEQMVCHAQKYLSYIVLAGIEIPSLPAATSYVPFKAGTVQTPFSSALPFQVVHIKKAPNPTLIFIQEE